jgi:hypothetical protein
MGACQTDAARAAGHHHDVSVEFQIHFASLSVPLAEAPA